MEKEFVPYEQALDLKELGFDEGCIGRWDGRYILNYYGGMCYNSRFDYDFIHSPWEFSAPTFSQAFRWFREKYDLKGFVSPIEYLDGTDDTYHWCIYNKCNSGSDQLTYEKAELECLKKLIEIVKEK